MKQVNFQLRRLLIFHIIFAYLILLSSCSNSDSIDVALIGAHSGKRSEVGVSIRNAVQLNVDQVNARGGVQGKKINLVTFDNNESEEKCYELLTEIIKNNFQFVLGPNYSSMAEATLKAISNKDILVISPTISTDYMTGRDDNFFRTALHTSLQAETLSQLTLKENFKKVAIIYDVKNAKYAEALFLSYKKLVEHHGVTITTAKGMSDNQQSVMLAIADEVNKTEPDAILLCLSAFDSANIAQQLHKVGSTAKLLGGSWAQTNDLLQHGGRTVEGMVLVAMHQKQAKETARYSKFKEEYYLRYNHEPSFTSVSGFDAANVLFEAMHLAKNISPTEVKREIIQKGEFESLHGKIQIDEYGDAVGAYKIVQVVNNTFEDINL